MNWNKMKNGKMLKREKVIFMRVIFVVLFVVLILLFGHICNLRFYKLGKYNVWPRYYAAKYLELIYPSKNFKYLSQHYDMRPVKESYFHIWEMHFEDGKGTRFEVYTSVYSSSADYGYLPYDGNYVVEWETYGQLQLEELVKEHFDLKQYRSVIDFKQGKHWRAHYTIRCTEANLDEVVDMIRIIHFAIKPIVMGQRAISIDVVNQRGENLWWYSPWNLEWNLCGGNMETAPESTPEAVEEFVTEAITNAEGFGQ